MCVCVGWGGGGGGGEEPGTRHVLPLWPLFPPPHRATGFADPPPGRRARVHYHVSETQYMGQQGREESTRGHSKT
jgi:hypothetical protein